MGRQASYIQNPLFSVDFSQLPGWHYNLHSVYGSLLDRAGWGLVPHQQRPNMLLLIPSRHTTLSTLIFCLIRSQKANSYPSPKYPNFYDFRLLSWFRGWIHFTEFTPIYSCIQVFNPSDSFGIADFSKINLGERFACRKITFEMISSGTLDRDANVAAWRCRSWGL